MVMELVVKEISRSNMPFMKQLTTGLAEVYCISDPSGHDNPIVYASKGFFRTTQYGREHVFGRNCRFLQGPQTSPAAIRRLSRSLQAGVETCETVLNYKRDGTPFLNLLMVAPLHDDQGHVKYHLGCQIDITPLLKDGRGLESFHDLLNEDLKDVSDDETDTFAALSRLGGLLTGEEAERLYQQRHTVTRSDESDVSPDRHFRRKPRRLYGIRDDAELSGQRKSRGSSVPPRLSTVYQNYLLVRPYPSLRIIFTSPALRISGLNQTKFLHRIGGDEAVRAGVSNALAEGVRVTARVKWLPTTTSATTTAASPHVPPRSFTGIPRDRWIHCTPLFGSDGRVGVWMVLMVEDEPITGQLNAHRPPGIIDHRRSIPIPPRGAFDSSFELGIEEVLGLERRPTQGASLSTANASMAEMGSRGRTLTRAPRPTTHTLGTTMLSFPTLPEE